MKTAPHDPTSEDHPLRLKDYAEVVDTRDEWEGLIGVVEEFVDENELPVRADSPRVAGVIVHVPTRGSGSAVQRLRDVNELTSYVRGQLRTNDDRQCFAPSKLAWFDPKWL